MELLLSVNRPYWLSMLSRSYSSTKPDVNHDEEDIKVVAERRRDGLAGGS